jgi:hypothetical protein
MCHLEMPPGGANGPTTRRTTAAGCTAALICFTPSSVIGAWRRLEMPGLR